MHTYVYIYIIYESQVISFRNQLNWSLGGISRDGALWCRPTYSHQFRHTFEWLGMTWSWSLLLHVASDVSSPWHQVNPWVACALSQLEQHCPYVWSSKTVAASHRICSVSWCYFRALWAMADIGCHLRWRSRTILCLSHPQSASAAWQSAPWRWGWHREVVSLSACQLVSLWSAKVFAFGERCAQRLEANECVSLLAALAIAMP